MNLISLGSFAFLVLVLMWKLQDLDRRAIKKCSTKIFDFPTAYKKSRLVSGWRADADRSGFRFWRVVRARSAGSTSLFEVLLNNSPTQKLCNLNRKHSIACESSCHWKKRVYKSWNFLKIKFYSNLEIPYLTVVDLCYASLKSSFGILDWLLFMEPNTQQRTDVLIERWIWNQLTRNKRDF